MKKPFEPYTGYKLLLGTYVLMSNSHQTGRLMITVLTVQTQQSLFVPVFKNQNFFYKFIVKVSPLYLTNPIALKWKKYGGCLGNGGYRTAVYYPRFLLNSSD